MAGLLKIEKAQACPNAPKWSAFLELGFRPFYLGASNWAALSILIGYTKHIASSDVACARDVMGVCRDGCSRLLTDCRRQLDGVNPLQGRALGALFGLWIIARIGFLSYLNLLLSWSPPFPKWFSLRGRRAQSARLFIVRVANAITAYGVSFYWACWMWVTCLRRRSKNTQY